MENVTIHVINEAGEEEKANVHLPASLGEMLKVEGKILPLGWQDPKAYFREQYFEEDKIYYIQYSRCWSREVEEEYGSGATALFMPSFREFHKQVFQVLRKKEVDKLIFDLRFNNGGHPEQGSEFVADLHNARIKGRGQLYLFVGRKTQAEAMVNALDFMRGADVVVVGEESGGRPNHFGEVRRFVLPESGLIVSHSSRYFRLPGGRSRQPGSRGGSTHQLSAISQGSGSCPGGGTQTSLNPSFLFQDQSPHDQVLGGHVSQHDPKSRLPELRIKPFEGDHAV
jgi:hypothetical protein